jgi:uncharacterized protein YbaR (Trm112 family)
MVSKELLDILVCPVCRVAVTLSTTGNELTCKMCNRAYPIRDGIPVMLVEEAQVRAQSE